VRSSLLLALLLLSACGSPFQEATELDRSTDPKTDAAPAEDSALPHEASPDAAPMSDAPTSVDSAPDHQDALPPTDVVSPPPDTGCKPFGVTTILCPDDTATSTTPTNYCVLDSTHGTSTLATTPAVCTCETSYTCACLEASVTVMSLLCAPTQVYAGCAMQNGAPLVTCEDP
jgi:hypothetical protein